MSHSLNERERVLNNITSINPSLEVIHTPILLVDTNSVSITTLRTIFFVKRIATGLQNTTITT